METLTLVDIAPQAVAQLPPHALERTRSARMGSASTLVVRAVVDSTPDVTPSSVNVFATMALLEMLTLSVLLLLDTPCAILDVDPMLIVNMESIAKPVSATMDTLATPTQDVSLRLLDARPVTDSNADPMPCAL